MKFSRRRLLAAAMLSSPFMAVADARWLEPEWVKIRRIRLNRDRPTHRVVHFTDVHHKGDRAYLLSVVQHINQLSPDVVCFTGDLIEEQSHLAEALELIAQIRAPVYGVPGNHDFWSKAPATLFAEAFRKTGGNWLVDRRAVMPDGKLSIYGAGCLSSAQPALDLDDRLKNVFLAHYPAWVKKLKTEKFDLILAGHSHGGQFRIPFWGPLMVPFGTEEYDLGLFQTKHGPLYVNPGIGWFPVPIRFNCRPEITVFEL